MKRETERGGEGERGRERGRERERERRTVKTLFHLLSGGFVTDFKL